MRSGGWLAGAGLGAFVAAGLLVAPSLQAQESRQAHPAKRQSIGFASGIGSFTPAAADPKLAAALTRSGLAQDGFRFTPSESRRNVSKALTVSLRSRAIRTAPVSARAETASTAPVGLAPTAYTINVTAGWKRLALSSDVTRINLVGQPGSRERADIGITYSGKRAGGKLTATSDHALAGTPAMVGDNQSYSFDLGGSYKLTRNLDVTAGVRYKAERDRLPRLTEQRRDSQAVYVGTAFRF